MMIGIIGAMAIEVEEILAKLEHPQTETISGMDFVRGAIQGVECVVARCYVGKVNAAICAQTMILRYAPSRIINSGVAGGIGADVKIGDLVLADGAIQHDVDTTQIGDQIGMVSGINLVVIPTSSEMNRVLAEAARRCAYQGNVHIGRIASGDQFISSAEKLHWIASTFGAVACEMESGSIAQVCYINGTEYTAVRCISDNADSNAGVDYEQFSTFAAHQTTELLCTALPMLENI